MTALLVLIALAPARSVVQDPDKGRAFRWNVKTLTDKEARLVYFNSIQPLDIEKMAKEPAPSKLNSHSPRGAGPQEFVVYKVTAYVVRAISEKDGDYHFLVKASPNSQTVMGIELPNPTAAKKSVRLSALKSARANALAAMRRLDIPVEIVGVGFWDSRSGEPGLANGFELHPVLTVSMVHKG